MKPYKIIYEIETHDCRTGFITVLTGRDLNPHFNTHYLHITSSHDNTFYKYYHGKIEKTEYQWYHNFTNQEIKWFALQYARSLFGVCSIRNIYVELQEEKI